MSKCEEKNVEVISVTSENWIDVIECIDTEHVITAYIELDEKCKYDKSIWKIFRFLPSLVYLYVNQSPNFHTSLKNLRRRCLTECDELYLNPCSMVKRECLPHLRQVKVKLHSYEILNELAYALSKRQALQLFEIDMKCSKPWPKYDRKCQSNDLPFKVEVNLFAIKNTGCETKLVIEKYGYKAKYLCVDEEISLDELACAIGCNKKLKTLELAVKRCDVNSRWEEIREACPHLTHLIFKVDKYHSYIRDLIRNVLCAFRRRCDDLKTVSVYFKDYAEIVEYSTDSYEKCVTVYGNTQLCDSNYRDLFCNLKCKYVNIQAPIYDNVHALDMADYVQNYYKKPSAYKILTY
jgi:hypothetical protein